jgi:hypothetical protein
MFFFLAYGKVYLVKKRNGIDQGAYYAMKVLSKAAVVGKKKTAEHTKTERQVSSTYYVYISSSIYPYAQSATG